MHLLTWQRLWPRRPAWVSAWRHDCCRCSLTGKRCAVVTGAWQLPNAAEFLCNLLSRRQPAAAVLLLCLPIAGRWNEEVVSCMAVGCRCQSSAHLGPAHIPTKYTAQGVRLLHSCPTNLSLLPLCSPLQAAAAEELKRTRRALADVQASLLSLVREHGV